MSNEYNRIPYRDRNIVIDEQKLPSYIEASKRLGEQGVGILVHVVPEDVKKYPNQEGMVEISLGSSISMEPFYKEVEKINRENEENNSRE